MTVNAEVNAGLGDIRAWRANPRYGRPKGAGGTRPDGRKQKMKMPPHFAPSVTGLVIAMQHNMRSQVIAMEVSRCVPPHGPALRIQPPVGVPADLSRQRGTDGDAVERQRVRNPGDPLFFGSGAAED